MSYIYLVKVKADGIYKIGYSANVETRVVQLSKVAKDMFNLSRVVLIDKIHCYDDFVLDVEWDLLQRYKGVKVPYTKEWFYLSTFFVEDFKVIAREIIEAETQKYHRKTYKQMGAYLFEVDE